MSTRSPPTNSLMHFLEPDRLLRHPLPSDLCELTAASKRASRLRWRSGRYQASPVTTGQPAHDDKNSCYRGRLVRTFGSHRSHLRSGSAFVTVSGVIRARLAGLLDPRESHGTRKRDCRALGALRRVVFAGAAVAQVPDIPTGRSRSSCRSRRRGDRRGWRRLIAQSCRKKRASNSTRENMTGAGRQSRYGAAAKAPADGLHHPVRVLELQRQSLRSYPSALRCREPLRPRDQGRGSPNGLFVHPDIPARSVEGAGGVIRAQSGKYTFASRIGTTPHLSATSRLTFGSICAWRRMPAARPRSSRSWRAHAHVAPGNSPATALVKDASCARSP